MTDAEPLLERLAEEWRREQQEAELERLAAGALPEHELTALLERAEGDADLSLSIAAHTPIAAARKEQMVGAIRSALGAGRAQQQSPAEQAAPAAVAALPTARRRSALTRVLRSKAVVLLPMAAAAGFVLLTQFSRNDPLAPLPDYVLEVRRGVVAQRSAPAPDATTSPVVLDPARPPVLVLRPAQRVEGPLVARAFAQSETGPRDVGQSSEFAEGGAVRLQLRDLAPLPGAGTLVVVVARTASVKEPARLLELARGEASSGAGWQRFRVEYRLLRPGEAEAGAGLEPAGDPTRLP